MATRPKGPRPIYAKPISAAMWTLIAESYLVNPRSEGFVQLCRSKGVPWRVARQAYNFGWPDLHFPPLRSLSPTREVVEGAIARAQANALEQTRTVTTVVKEAIVTAQKVASDGGEEVKRRSAEMRATRRALESALQAVTAANLYGKQVVRMLRDGQVDLPDTIDIRTISMLARAASISSAALERAIRVERIREGKPTEVVGMQIGVMLERATEEELAQIQQTGKFPARLLGGRTSEDVIDVEAVDEDDLGADEPADPELVPASSTSRVDDPGGGRARRLEIGQELAEVIAFEPRDRVDT